MAELLFEIRSEEIPARMQVRAGRDLEKMLTDGLKAAGLTVDGAQVLTGPRRLVFTADIPLRSPDISEERKGPRVGAPERALEGFMKAAGLSDISDAEIRSDKKGDFYVAILSNEGRDTGDILTDLIPDIMGRFPWPKSMKSGSSSFRWVRPLRGLIVLLDGKSIELTVGGIASGVTTMGHRQHGPGPFTVSGFEDYQSQLEGAGHVRLSHDARKDLIAMRAKDLCESKGLELVDDAGLLDEVAGLAEWPVVILGDMDPRFLDLPGEVIRLSMRTHQKYFAVRDPKTGGLAPNFVVVSNNDAPDGGVAIAQGNAKVLSARLSDAVFFQDEDRKQSLFNYYEKLDTVVFHKKLGSIKDKAERVAALARSLAPKVGADPDKAEQAARLAKCDLVTQTVVEFTSLQGQIGRLMYESEGGDPSIAAAIEDHYKPQGPSDSVPTDPVAIAVALADKIDTLIGFWAIDEKPTGSKDPFALRRAALGLVRIVLGHHVRFDWNNAVSQILLTALYYGFFLDKNQDVRQFYEDLCDSYDPQYDKEPKFHLWAEKPYRAYLNEDGLIDKFEANIGGAIIGFPWHSGDPDDVEDLEEARIGYSKLRLLREKCKKLGEDANAVHVLPMFSNLNNHIASYVKFSPDKYPMVHQAATTLIDELIPFILDRLKVYLRDQGARHDIIDAVFAIGGDDLVAIRDRVTALQSFIETEDGENLLAGMKRTANILKAEAKKGDLPSGNIDKLSHPLARDLQHSLSKAQTEIDAALAEDAYSTAMTALSQLRAPIDAFFEDVTVNDDDPTIRKNNLLLLGMIRDTARRIADFDAIQG